MPSIIVNNSDRELVYAADSPIEAMLKDIDIFAPTHQTVLITGANGTGKETVARLIHDKSKRKDKSFHAVNCASMPENLLESLLFGHEKGAYTSAFETTKGIFEAANGGTLFLDEIGEMPATMQTRLLRALQERKITRVGSNKEIPIDVRVIAATNIDIEQALKTGKLRKDLFYRLEEATINVPDLVERQVDIAPLAQYFADNAAKEQGWNSPKLNAKTIAALESHTWPGNVRELQNMVKAAVVRAHYDGVAVNPDMLRWRKPASEHKAFVFKDVESLDVGAILTRNNTIPHTQISHQSHANRNSIHLLLQSNHEPGVIEKLGYYLLKRDGEQVASAYFLALLKRLDEKHRKEKAMEAGPTL